MRYICAQQRDVRYILYEITDNSNFRDMLPTIWLSPLGSPIIRKYTKPFNAFKRRRMYPNVSKCNAKRCVCCTHLCTKTIITSSVNGRQLKGYFHLCPHMDFLQTLHINNSLYTNYENVFIELDS